MQVAKSTRNIVVTANQLRPKYDAEKHIQESVIKFSKKNIYSENYQSSAFDLTSDESRTSKNGFIFLVFFSETGKNECVSYLI